MDKSFCEEWEYIHANQEWGKYPSESVIRFVARNYYKVRDRSQVKVLDFGCGGGAHTWYLAREGFDTYAFDGSVSAIRKVEKLLENEKLSAKLNVYDAVNIEYAEDFFDAVIDNVCICSNTLDNIRKMYSNIYCVLKKGGKLFTSSFSTDTTGYKMGEEIEPDTYKDITEGNLAGRGIAHFWIEEKLRNILQETGFSNIIIEPLEYMDRGSKVSIFNVTAEK